MQMEPSLFLREIDKNCLRAAGTESYAGQSLYARQPIAGRIFNPFDFNKASAKTSELEERCGWRRGQRLFHDNYGYGAVIEVKDSEDGPVVRVAFDNGLSTTFLSEIQGRAFEKIGDDA